MVAACGTCRESSSERSGSEARKLAISVSFSMSFGCSSSRAYLPNEEGGCHIRKAAPKTAGDGLAKLGRCRMRRGRTCR